MKSRSFPRLGFTLLELAIVLVVLALLMSGILAWQDWSEAMPSGPAAPSRIH